MPITRTVTFIAPREIEIREAPLPALSPDEVLVETICSAISPGTEMLIYRGQFPRDLPDSHDFVSAGTVSPPVEVGGIGQPNSGVSS